MSQEKYWSLLAPGTHLPRLWLVLSQEHLLIGWENISRIRATVDFLSLSFVEVTISSDDLSYFLLL